MPAPVAAYRGKFPRGKRTIVLTLQPAAAAGIDTDVNTYASNYNYGISIGMGVGLVLAGRVYRSLLRFSLASIPASATCISAVLTIVNFGHSGQTAACPLKVYGILAANDSWVEGTQNGAPANGETCWQARQLNGQNWAGHPTGGCGVAGTDYEATAWGAVTCGDDVQGTPYDCSLTPAKVATWFGSDVNNHGILLRADDEGTIGKFVYLFTSDYSSYQPKLVVTYRA